MSVASTLAPSAAKASAAARPIPCAAAVTKARLPRSRPAMTGKLPRAEYGCTAFFDLPAAPVPFHKRDLTLFEAWKTPVEDLMIKGLHHNAYRCRDSEETRRFYE